MPGDVQIDFAVVVVRHRMVLTTSRRRPVNGPDGSIFIVFQNPA